MYYFRYNGYEPLEYPVMYINYNPYGNNNNINVYLTPEFAVFKG